jgi:hypothetical protein
MNKKTENQTGYEYATKAMLLWWRDRVKRVGNYKFVQIMDQTIRNKEKLAENKSE